MSAHGRIAGGRAGAGTYLCHSEVYLAQACRCLLLHRSAIINHPQTRLLLAQLLLPPIRCVTCRKELELCCSSLLCFCLEFCCCCLAYAATLLLDSTAAVVDTCCC